MSDLSDRIAKLSPQQRKLLAQKLTQDKKAASDTQQPVITPRHRHQAALSFAQERLWFIHQMDPHSPHYNEAIPIYIRGAVQVSVLENILNPIVERHAVLRTTFVTIAGEPIQQINPAQSVKLAQFDLQGFPAPHREAEMWRVLSDEARKPFDLTIDPLLRAALIQLADDEFVLLMTIHHIAFDGWSGGVLMREFALLYRAVATGETVELPPLPVQYIDFAIWQREQLQGAVLNERLDYWKEKLGHDLPVLSLPADHPRPRIQTFAGATETILIPPDIYGQLKSLAQESGSTLFMVLLAAFNTLLYRYTRQTDIVIGSPVSGRERTETYHLLGCFINTLVLRTDLSDNPTFRELINRVREMALGAYQHQDLPFERLVEALQPERDLSRSPLFQVLFVLQNTPQVELTIGEMSICQLDPPTQITKFDLTLEISEHDAGLSARFEYNTDLLDQTTIQRMAAHFKNVLIHAAALPDQPIAALPILSEAETHQLLVEWNETARDYRRDLCVHQWFEAQVKQTPDAIAAVLGDHHLTYHDLNCRANQLAHYLRGAGIGPESLVGICVPRSFDMLVSVLAVLKAGGAYVPLDPAYPPERLAYVIQDAQLAMILTHTTLSKRFSTSESLCFYLDRDGVALDSQPITNPDSGVTADNLVYVIYTSGSTGHPKGTLIEHRGLVNYLTWCLDQYTSPVGADYGALLHSSLGFDLTVTSVFTPLLQGRSVLLLPDHVDALTEVLRKDAGCDLLKVTPSHLRLLNSQLTAESAHNKVQVLIIGGEALRGEDLALWQATSTRLINEYGPTETVVGCCVYEVKPGETPGSNVLIGRPIYNTSLYILDAHYQPVPVGVAGELYIAGDGVARGYLNRPELTAARFIDNPFGAGRMYRTGDWARYQPDGNIEFLGRIDDQVKIRGYRIELGEIETALKNEPNIEDAVVIANKSKEGDQRLVAYIVPRQKPAPSMGMLRQFLARTLPDYMIPVAFVALDEIPLTTNGKVDRKALPQPFWARIDTQPYVTPRTPTEQTLAEIWSRVLNVKQVGIHDNFFELGGHSLLATQVFSQIREQLQVELPIRLLFEAPTIAEFVVQVDKALAQTRPTGPAITTVDRSKYRLNQ
jgi:amino acid adenylation domain-containing protein